MHLVPSPTYVLTALYHKLEDLPLCSTQSIDGDAHALSEYRYNILEEANLIFHVTRTNAYSAELSCSGSRLISEQLS